MKTEMTIQLLAQLGLQTGQLQAETVVITGAGGGIGLEAARALLWLGANVVIAEIDARAGEQAAHDLGQAFSPDRVLFVQTDVGDPASIQRLADHSEQRFGQVDAVINNATIAVLGTVLELPIEQWDASYRVNLRGPVLLAQAFLPGMIARRHGAFVCVSSTGTAYLGGYETFKAAQVHLGNTLDAELEGSGVYALTIGPGLVMTNTARSAVIELAPRMGMTFEDFLELNKNAILTVEEAGVGFALAVLYAGRFHGQEVSSLQTLKAADISFGSSAPVPSAGLDHEQQRIALERCQAVIKTLAEQSAGWKQRSIFERQWVVRDFRKTAGMPVEEWLASLRQLEEDLKAGSPLRLPPLEKLAGYYTHLGDLAKGYEKDPVKLEDSLRYIRAWVEEVRQLQQALE